ncbi:hypothetical protein PC115_g5500 [Phytophthora cactorum]|uniref:Uncharacterized protein n=1 Tax=Phytophthora cactorum TaxID=29920 RepID=A0A8T1D0W3_9STRA|nr:hypothetical protein PC115_g5500 [Phytophthora cactorum]
MTKSTKKAAKTTSDEESLSARLEEESKEWDESTPLHAAIEFWFQLRAILAANSHSTGIEALDRRVSKLLVDDNFPAALKEVVLFLPAPDLMEASHAQDHSVFKTPTTRARIKRSSSCTPAKAPPAKKQRTAKKKAKARIYFDLPTGVDAALGATWSASPQLLSAFIEEMDYHDLLTAFEDTVHDNLMWFGGRAAKHASGANDDPRSPGQEDLGTLFKRHRRRYDKVIAKALDSFEVDSHGYRSIPEMFELSQALDPTRPKNLCLSDKALARITLDVTTGRLPKENRVGNRNRAQILTEGKPIVVHTERPFQTSEVGDDDSDIEEDGEYIALKPSAPVQYKPPSSPKKNLARYLGLSSDEEDLKQEHGKPCFDQEDEEDQDEAREDKEQEADEQEDEEGDDEAVDHQPPSDSNATRTTTTDSSKADKRSNASPTPASPRNPK